MKNVLLRSFPVLNICGLSTRFCPEISSALNLTLKPLSLAVGSLLGSEAYGVVTIDVAVNNMVSSSGVDVLQIGVTEGDKLRFSVSSNLAEREQMGNAKCTVSGRLALAEESTADSNDIDFINDGIFSYEVSFSDAGSQVGEASVEATVNRDELLDEQEEFSVTVLAGSGKVSCSGTAGEVIAPVDSLGWGQLIPANGDYAYELYKIKLIDAPAPESDPVPNPDPDPKPVPPNEGEPIDVRKLDIILKQVQAATDIALFNAQSKTRSIARELARRRQGEVGFSANNFSVKLNGHNFALGRYLSNASSNEQEAHVGRWGGFVSGNIEMGDSEDGEVDIEFGSSLITAGFDWQSQQWVVGMAVSMANSDADVALERDAAELSQNGVSVFASYYKDMFYLDMIVSNSRSSYDFKRTEQNTLTSYASTDGREVGFAFGTGIEGHIGKTDYSFFLLYDYLDMSVDSFAEFNNVTVASFDRTSQQLELGARVGHAFNSKVGVFVPFASVSYRDNLENDPTTLVYSQNAEQIAQASFNAVDQDAYFSAQLGLSAVFPHGISVFASYENDLTSDRWSRQRYDLGVRWEY